MVRPSKIQRILQGWGNYLFPDAAAEAAAKSRARICASCPAAVYGTYEQLMPDYSLKEVEGMKCWVCGCPLSTKLRSLEETCPQKKW